MTDFVQKWVIRGREFAIRGWRNWVLEDPLVHPYKLGPYLVPPAPFLSFDPKDTVDGSGVFG